VRRGESQGSIPGPQSAATVGLCGVIRAPGRQAAQAFSDNSASLPDCGRLESGSEALSTVRPARLRLVEALRRLNQSGSGGSALLGPLAVPAESGKGMTCGE
jgi:hypothetical protein